MLGTTHPANAIIQRRDLGRVGVLRLAAPASLAIRPGASWPQDLHRSVIGPTAIVGGGFEFDGVEIAPLDIEAIRRFAGLIDETVTAVAVTSAFAPASFDHEIRALEILEQELGLDFPVSLSYKVGSIGLLERENATILNAALLGVARSVVNGFQAALAEHGLSVASYLTQNDGTLMSADEALRIPILTVGSGPTNSMRGACALAGLSDAVVIDRNVLEWRLDPSSEARLPFAAYDLPVIVICQQGYSSSLAAATLQQLGIWRATDVIGGYEAWQAAGLG